MRSFRLDRDSFPTPGGWIALAVAAALALATTWGGAFSGARGRAWLAAFGVLTVAMLARDLIAGRLAERFPEARGRWLLGAGLVVLTSGVAFLLASPRSARGPVDLVWLGPAFGLILAFVVLNRGDRDVVE